MITAQRSCSVRYALMGISFFLLIWVGTFVLMLK
nr:MULTISPECIES: membrane protein YpdK [unclassified Pantoea]